MMQLCQVLEQRDEHFVNDCIAVLCVDCYGEQTLTALFNFSEHERAVVLEEIVPYTDLMTGEKRDNKVIYLKPYAFLWAMADETAE